MSESAIAAGDYDYFFYREESPGTEAGDLNIEPYWDNIWGQIDANATRYYVAIVAEDGSGNRSRISNVVYLDKTSRAVMYAMGGQHSSAPAWTAPVITSSSGKNTDLFRMSLIYDQTLNDQDPLTGSLRTSTAQFNGNISAWRWQTADGAGTPQGYQYEYDRLNRLKKADYQEVAFGSWLFTGKYDLSGGSNGAGIVYDLNGNIESLHRKGHLGGGSYGFIDKLDYAYHGLGNRLEAVEDQVANNTNLESLFEFKDTDWTNIQNPEYDYDANGNMTYDANKRIQVSYNHFNKPTLVEFLHPTTGQSTGKQIAYSYDAAGTKLRQRVIQTVIDSETGATSWSTESTDYIAGFHYLAPSSGSGQGSGSPSSRELQFFAFEEGRVLYNAATAELHYQFDLKDHLGNVRVSFRENPAVAGVAELTQTDSYYPGVYPELVEGACR